MSAAGIDAVEETAVVLAQTAGLLARTVTQLADVATRVERLENALCLLVQDKTLPMDTRMDIASALLPTGDET